MQAQRTSSSSRPAPSRRKACEDCSKSKRRCDLNIPCSRCAGLGLTCHYQVPPRHRSRHAGASAAGQSETPGSSYSFLLDTGTLDDALLLNSDLDLPLFGDVLKSDSLAYSSNLLPGSGVIAVTENVSIDLFDLESSRLQFIIDIFKSSPSYMAREGSTVWCHALLYKEQMPKSMHGKI